jgi:hypothetical protein
MEEEILVNIIKDLKNDLRDSSFYTEQYSEEVREKMIDLLMYVRHMDLDEFWEEE